MSDEPDPLGVNIRRWTYGVPASDEDDDLIRIKVGDTRFTVHANVILNESEYIERQFNDSVNSGTPGNPIELDIGTPELMEIYIAMLYGLHRTRQNESNQSFEHEDTWRASLDTLANGCSVSPPKQLIAQIYEETFIDVDPSLCRGFICFALLITLGDFCVYLESLTLQQEVYEMMWAQVWSIKAALLQDFQPERFQGLKRSEAIWLATSVAAVLELPQDVQYVSFQIIDGLLMYVCLNLPTRDFVAGCGQAAKTHPKGAALLAERLCQMEDKMEQDGE